MKTCPRCQGNFPTDFSLCPRDGSALVEAGAWREGTIVREKYRIACQIGEGGMGTVYKALHIHFDEVRALKVIRHEYVQEENFLRRFMREAVIMRRLRHPNAVRVDDIEKAEDGRPFIVMEYVEGQNLRDVVDREAPMAVEVVCSVVKQVAAALEAAHELGMVHRDIKPANIVLVETSGGEQVKVLDFGIAKVKEQHLEDSNLRRMTLTGTGMVIGTPAYMSPEQAEGKKGEDLDGRSDLYSLGVVMYQMLAGDLPLKADSGLHLLWAHIHTPPRPLREYRPDVPEAVRSLVMSCLEKDRDRRPANARSLIHAIEYWEQEGQRKEEAIRAEEERLLRERAEQDRLMKEKLEQERWAREEKLAERLKLMQKEMERLAQEKRQAEREAVEAADRERAAGVRAEQERLAREKTDRNLKAWELAEAERLAKIRAEADRLALEKAQAEQKASEAADRERKARAIAEQERLAREKVETERKQAEAERLAKIQAEAERLALEKKEAERQAAEAAERERLARVQAERERLASEKVERQLLESRRIAGERRSHEDPQTERLPQPRAGDGTSIVETLGKRPSQQEPLFEELFSPQRRIEAEVRARSTSNSNNGLTTELGENRNLPGPEETGKSTIDRPISTYYAGEKPEVVLPATHEGVETPEPLLAVGDAQSSVQPARSISPQRGMAWGPRSAVLAAVAVITVVIVGWRFGWLHGASNHNPPTVTQTVTMPNLAPKVLPHETQAQKPIETQTSKTQNSPDVVKLPVSSTRKPPDTSGHGAPPLHSRKTNNRPRHIAPETANAVKQETVKPTQVNPNIGAIHAAVVAGDTDYQNGKYDAAIKEYQKALQLNPTESADINARVDRAKKSKEAEAAAGTLGH